MPIPLKPEPQTLAAKRYMRNVERMVGLIGAVNKVWEPIKAANEVIAPRVPQAKPGDAVDKQLDKLVAASNAAFATTQFAFEWYLAMIVTFAEAYLEDILAAAAVVEPALMKESDIKASYSEISSSTSIDELAGVLRHRWARNFITDGGPTKWTSRLTKLGAPAFADAHLRELEELWGMRHMVVHRVGRVSADFVKRHPQLGYKDNEQLDLSKDHVLNYFECSGKLVGITDAFFLKWIPSLASSAAV